MSLSLRDMSRALVEAYEGASASERSKILDRFISEVQKRGLAMSGERILRLVAEAADAREAASKMKVIAAHDVRPGKMKEAEVSVEPELLGGFRAVSRSTMIDMSLAGSLNQIAESFRH